MRIHIEIHYFVSLMSGKCDIAEMKCVRNDDVLFPNGECKCFYVSINEKEKQLDKFHKYRLIMSCFPRNILQGERILRYSEEEEGVKSFKELGKRAFVRM